METRRKPQLLLSLIVVSALFSQMSAWPLFATRFLRVPLVEENELDRASIKIDTDISKNAFPEKGRHVRQANKIFASDLSRLLDDLPDKIEAFNEKRDLDNIAEDWAPRKRQADSIFTDQYSRHLKQTAAKKYLESVLKHQRENGGWIPN